MKFHINDYFGGIAKDLEEDYSLPSQISPLLGWVVALVISFVCGVGVALLVML